MRPGTGPLPHIASLSTAVPSFRISQQEAGRRLADEFQDRLSRRAITTLKKLFAHPSIRERSFAIEDPMSFFGEDPDSRMERFRKNAVALAAEAAGRAMGAAGLGPEAVSDIVVTTCTGYLCPGLSGYLIEELGLAPTAGAYDLVGSGCGGAIPNLRMASALLKNASGGPREKVVLSIAVEVCSATFQMGEELSLLISNALFADGAAAAVLWNRPEGLQIVASAGRLSAEHREDIRYIYKNGQLHNQLSLRLPALAGRSAAQLVKEILGGRDLKEIKHWALHTGGEKILGSMERELVLAPEQLAPARKVLSSFGNMSSPTVLFVLKEIVDSGMQEQEECMMVSFGAGFSVYGMLLRKSL
jgi:predicted naringenin-chalcone synthase